VRKILYLVPAIFEDLKKKGVTHLFLEKDEFGFFDYVYTVHFPTPKTTIIKMSAKNFIYEYAEDLLPWLNNIQLKSLYKFVNIHYFLRRTYSLIRKEKINIIRANDPFQKGVYAYILSKLTRVPFCISIHADYDKRWELDGPACGATVLGSNKVANLLAYFVLSRTKIVMPIRESLAKYAIRHGAKPETIRIIPHGIDLKPFLSLRDSFASLTTSFKKEFGLEGKRIVVFAGRLSKDNYVYDILEVAKKISERRKDAIFAMVGGGKEEENLKRKVKEDKLENTVNFLGFQPHNKVIELRKNADVNLCLMGGFSLIESCASGRPVIAYDVEWHYELIKNEETGFLIEEGNTDRVTEKIISLLNDEQLAQRLGTNAKKLAIEKHSIENTSKIKISVYDEILKMSQ